MNFCFWPDNPAGEFEYEHMTRNLEKILNEDPEFFTPNHLAQVTEADLQTRVFKAGFSLLDERARLVRQVGKEIGRDGGSFLSFIN